MEKLSWVLLMLCITIYGAVHNSDGCHIVLGTVHTQHKKQSLSQEITMYIDKTDKVWKAEALLALTDGINHPSSVEKPVADSGIEPISVVSQSIS